MRNRIVLSLALAFLMAPLAFAGQDAQATNAADSCFQVSELALAQSQPQVVMVGALPPSSVGDCVSRCEALRQRFFQACLDSGRPANRCAQRANLIARRCKDRCRGGGTSD